MFGLKKFLSRITTPQYILLGGVLLSGGGALIIGVADNLPGIALMYLCLACLAGAWVWNWRSPREYWTLLVAVLAAFPVSMVLHTLLYALRTVVANIPVLWNVIYFLEVFFFLVAVAAAAPAGIVALLGGMISSWRGMDRLTRKNRSFRRFDESKNVTEKTLRKLVNLARQSASSANIQPLKYVLSFQPEKNRLIFSTLSWAGYLPEWTGPAEGERPTAYLIMLGDKELANSFQYDAGIASQSITLGAVELGLGACLIGSINRELLREVLSLEDRYEILLVIALGKPGETVVLDDIEQGGSIKYWRDENDRHHVPKRKLKEVILQPD